MRYVEFHNSNGDPVYVDAQAVDAFDGWIPPFGNFPHARTRLVLNGLGQQPVYVKESLATVRELLENASS